LASAGWLQWQKVATLLWKYKVPLWQEEWLQLHWIDILYKLGQQNHEQKRRKQQSLSEHNLQRDRKNLVCENRVLLEHPVDLHFVQHWEESDLVFIKERKVENWEECVQIEYGTILLRHNRWQQKEVDSEIRKSVVFW